MKKWLLLVEDNLINQRLTKLILEKEGFEVLTASNGQEAIDVFTSMHELQLIMMDIQMPVLNGLEATAIIRLHEKEHQLKRIPIIALTADGLKEDREKCLAMGCDDHLSKPIQIDLMLKIIKQYL
jgi:CheY-like chemotaxis protein